MKFVSELELQLPGLRSLRQDIHANPEASFEEVRTSAIVAKRLRAAGIETHEGIGNTGVVGVLRGKLPDNGKCIGLRADMDALRMTEHTGLSYASHRPGVFHGCGHDGHTTMLMGAAEYLARTRDFAGTVVFIFQPAEEAIAGAKAMIDDGLFERFPCTEVYAVHNAPHMKPGQIAVKPGVMLASGDSFEITVTGIGGHGARPHEARDTISALGQLIVAVQTIVSRGVDPMDVAVVSFGTLDAGKAPNVLPETAFASGTMRSYNEKTRAFLKTRMAELCEGIGRATGTRIDVTFPIGCPATFNHPEQAEFAAEVARGIVSPANVLSDFPAIMASEDFAVMLQHRPGAYLLLGQDGFECHHPKFDFNDDILPIGISLFVRMVEQRLGGTPDMNTETDDHEC
ncbi:M20 aminoacylase family protein [Burkholderia cepacia]|uniref:M20 aminoacylase family protein n=1 Tax=Burkholderia cepacia TaxID=292 RepID=UPI001576D2ED|nr:M20 aminoacylase family protein [Burkholderia cepacia]NTX21303.1 amidohydrolase [Burkholderia cepacia]